MRNWFVGFNARTRRWLTMRLEYAACFKTSQEGSLTDAGAEVMRDLAQFCGAYSSSAKVNPLTRAVDPLAMAMAEGRRQVYHHIQRRLRLTEQQIIDMMEERENERR